MDRQQLEAAGALTITSSGDWLIAVHAQPGAQTTEVVGLHGDRLKVRLKAPPVDGKANKALLLWAASYFEVSRSDVELIRGITSRQKTLKITMPN